MKWHESAEKPQRHKSWFMDGFINPKTPKYKTFMKDTIVVTGDFSEKDKTFDGRAIVIARALVAK